MSAAAALLSASKERSREAYEGVTATAASMASALFSAAHNLIQSKALIASLVRPSSRDGSAYSQSSSAVARWAVHASCALARPWALCALRGRVIWVRCLRRGAAM